MTNNVAKTPCVEESEANVQVSLRSKRFRLVSEQKETVEGDFRFWSRENLYENQKMNEGVGEGKEGIACKKNRWFWKPAFASVRSAWLARLVEQYWHVSIKGLFYTERSFTDWSARFTLQGKSIFFTFFWNAKLFLRLYKGFRSFNLFSKVSPGSE